MSWAERNGRVRHKVLIALCMAVLVFSSGQAFAEPYATTADVPKSMENRDQWIDTMKQIQAKIPDRGDISIPPYPGAVVASSIWEAGEFNVLQLVTADPKEEVEVFYKQNLPDFNYAVKLMNPSFFKGPEETFQPMQKGQQLPYVVLTPVISGGMESKLVPGAVTRVQIYYAPSE